MSLSKAHHEHTGENSPDLHASEGAGDPVSFAELFKKHLSVEEPEERFHEVFKLFNNEDPSSGFSYYELEDNFRDIAHFQLKWEQDHDNYGARENLFEARKVWVEMKKGGKEFVDALERRISDALEKDPSLAYHLIMAHRTLKTEKENAFYATLLANPMVWNSGDSSIAGKICKYLSESRDPVVVPAVVEYIEHICSPEYARLLHRVNDLGRAVNVLMNVLGAEAISLLDAQAEKDSVFKLYWAAKKKKTPIPQHHVGYPSIKEDPPFALEYEVAYLEQLEQELKQTPKEQDSPDDPSWYDDWENDHSSDGYSPSLHDRDFPKERSPYKKNTINFYGRFRPHLERPVSITQENVLRAFYSVMKKENRTPEDYLNVLSGVVDETELIPELPDEEWTPQMLKALTDIISARIPILATVDRNVEQARGELDQMLRFMNTAVFSRDAEKTWHACQKTLSRLSAHLFEFSPPDEKLPESAQPFFVYHQRFKKVRQIPAFEELLAEKIRHLAALKLSGQLVGHWDLDDIQRIYQDKIKLYGSIDKEDVPIYWEAAEKLDEAGASRLVVFGRDGRYLL